MAFGKLHKLLKMGNPQLPFFQKSGAEKKNISVGFGVEIYRRTLKWLVVGNEEVLQSAIFFWAVLGIWWDTIFCLQ